MPKKRSTYHHGDLKEALIQSADAIIAEGGIEAFSLRAAAKRAGVSPAAPAHHFGSAKGLLTEVALLAFERADRYLQDVGLSEDVAQDLRALCMAFIKFALDHPGHFRLMFRNDLINRQHPRYPTCSQKSGKRISYAIAAYQGKTDLDCDSFEDSADTLCGIATMHGLAHLVLDEKAICFFDSESLEDFLKVDLPKVLERLYPSLGSAKSPDS